ncbi:PQQ-binding-like beta-propeller repeat protein [Candidatus Bathyarchaeota archaeon A05DMB-2]|jgi:hypothetical protein|nr:PQQ-binding-like beta-propeller repeat protein [Candidatus Bathyarchaeota archaeon A05DMB-2]
MQILKGKKSTTAIALFLVLTFAVSLTALPLANAHTPPWEITTYAYINVAPNPVGKGQQVLIVFWLDLVIQNANISNNIRFRNYQLTITKPDNTTETTTIDFVTDSTSSAYIPFTPDQAGIYRLNFTFPGQVYDYGGPYQGDYYTASTALTTLTVQEEPITKLPTTPLPTEYWTRPINAQNLLWGIVSSNWLGGAANSASTDIWQKDGSAPRSAHIMWTKPYEFGGLVGGTRLPDATYYQGFSYETRFSNPIIISGVLYYLKPLNHAGSGGGYTAVDLRTGEEIWSSDTLGSLTSAAPSKAQLYEVENPDQHGVVPPILWQVVGATWNAYDAFSGKYLFNLTGVPAGTEAYTPKGEILRYILSYNTTSRSGRLLQWNNTAAILNSADVFNLPGWRPVGTTINAQGTPAVHGTAYDFNVTVTADLTGSAAPTIVGVIPGDLILGRSSNVQLTSLPNPNTNPWTLWALNLNASRGPIGSLLWRQDYAAPPGNITRMLAWQPIDTVYRTFTMTDFETGQRLGYSLDTGELLWGPVGPTDIGFQYYSSREGFPAMGNLYVTGYGGIVYCYSMKNGTLLWTYGNGGPGNSTSSGDETPWGRYPTHAAAVADGILYTMSGEHSPNTPLYKGYRARAINATTGQEIWTLLDWSASGLGTSVAPVAIADGYMVFLNAYDGQLYCVGKGPSAMTVTAPDVSIELGRSLVIRGTVTDESPGSKIKGTAAISDESMTAWMEYMFMQQPRPANATGVPVTISVIDSNNNVRTIGQVTSDTSGKFSLQWTPDIPGNYTVIATFAGSNSYWPSSAETFFAVDPAPQATPTPTPPPQSAADLYFVPAVIGIIIAIVVVGAVIILMQRKRP